MLQSYDWSGQHSTFDQTIELMPGLFSWEIVSVRVTSAPQASACVKYYNYLASSYMCTLTFCNVPLSLGGRLLRRRLCLRLLHLRLRLLDVVVVVGLIARIVGGAQRHDSFASALLAARFFVGVCARRHLRRIER